MHGHTNIKLENALVPVEVKDNTDISMYLLLFVALYN